MIYLLVAELRCLIQAAREFSIDFVYALSPGLDIAFASKDDNLSLKAKLDQVNLRKLSVSLSIVQLSFMVIVIARLRTNDGLSSMSNPGSRGRVFITVRNEVAKVMFLQVSVCPQGGGAWSWRGEGCMVPGGVHGRGVGIPAFTEADPPPRETATAADGTPPTGTILVQ